MTAVWAGPTLWQPRSTCGTQCLPAESTAVGPLTATVRLVAVVGVLLSGVLLVPVLVMLRGRARAATVRTLARALLTALGTRLVLRGRLPRRGSLLVANHVSWLDVVVLAAVAPTRLVAKSDVRGWPGLGALAAASGTIFVDRARPKALPDTVAEVADALRAGTSVTVFPEGTTYCGADQGPFRPAMFQAAVDAGAPVVPMTVSYQAGGQQTLATAFVGDDTLWTSVRRVCGLRGVTVSLVSSPALHPVPGADRRMLARAAQSSVRLTALPASASATDSPAAAAPSGPAARVHPAAVAGSVQPVATSSDAGSVQPVATSSDAGSVQPTATAAADVPGAAVAGSALVAGGLDLAA
jgi:1-acyl-sn-glycerol-3-phosphate acyltransferase